MKKQSEKDVVERTGISVSKIDSILNDIILSYYFKISYSFIIVNNESSNIFDIQDSRKYRNL